jgi:hypothetical protein
MSLSRLCREFAASTGSIENGRKKTTNSGGSRAHGGTHGVRLPSALRTHRYVLRIVGVTYRGKLLREPLTILWDKRRPLPPYATAFCEMLAEYVREVFPITRPSEPKTTATKQATVRRAKKRNDG